MLYYSSNLTPYFAIDRKTHIRGDICSETCQPQNNLHPYKVERKNHSMLILHSTNAATWRYMEWNGEKMRDNFKQTIGHKKYTSSPLSRLFNTSFLTICLCACGDLLFMCLLLDGRAQYVSFLVGFIYFFRIFLKASLLKPSHLFISSAQCTHMWEFTVLCWCETSKNMSPLLSQTDQHTALQINYGG